MQNRNFTQDVVIRALKTFNLPYDQEGVCFGIGFLRLLEFLSKDPLVASVLQRMIVIPPSQLKTLVSGLVMKGEPQEIIETKAQEFINKLKEQNRVLSDSDRQMMVKQMTEATLEEAQKKLEQQGHPRLTVNEAATILAILQAISIAQFPHLYNQDISNELSESQVDSIDVLITLLQPASLTATTLDQEGYEQSNITPIEQICPVPHHNLLDLLTNLKTIFAEINLQKDERVAILLGSCNQSFLHTVMLGYDPEKKAWTYCDPNPSNENTNKTEKILTNEKAVLDEILKSYRQDTSQVYELDLYAGNPATAKKISEKIPLFVANCHHLQGGGTLAIKEAVQQNNTALLIRLLQKGARLLPEDHALKQLNDFTDKLAMLEKFYSSSTPQRMQALKDIQTKILESYELYIQKGDALMALDNLIKDIGDIKTKINEDHQQHGTLAFNLFGKSFALTSSELAGKIEVLLDQAIANQHTIGNQPK